jgi:hypothetical protein
MGMESKELLKLVEECPKGSETLITRIIHVLTDKGEFSWIESREIFLIFL